MHLDKLIKQKSYEHVVHLLRRHWITFIPFLVGFFALLLVPVALYIFFQNFEVPFGNATAWYTAGIIVGGIYYLFLLVFFFTRFVEFYLDLWIVTNDRIIDIEQFGLFSRSISELELFRIQDVTTHINGVFPTFFNYGDVDIKTASKNTTIIFKNIHNPNRIREELLQLSHEDRKYHYSPPVSEDD